MKFNTTTQEILQINPTNLDIHPIALTTPKMGEDQYSALKVDIEMRGQVEPVLVYRGKIIDGRHRWLILQELGVDTIKYINLPNNTTLSELNSVVLSKEMRRHESPAQLAIRAYRLKTAPDSPYKSFAESARAIGANDRRVSEAKQIAEMYGRPDILQLLFDGEKFNTGGDYKPNWTDSLPAILNWLIEHGRPLKSGKQIAAIQPRKELTEDEQLIVNTYVSAILKESNLAVEEIARRLYAIASE